MRFLDSVVVRSPVTSSPDDDELAARLFERHGPAVRRYLRRLTGHAEVANDLTQDVYLRVVRSAGNYEPREREQAWLFRIARHVFLDHRKERSRRPQPEEASVENAAAPAQAIRIDLDAALERLDATDRDAFLLCEVGGLRYDEIASQLGLTVASVRSRIYRARLKLREMVTPPAPVRSMTHVRRRDDDE